MWPEQIIDYLALIGDSSDNIPGIDKVGPKTAAKWLATWKTLDEIIEHAAEISGKVGENLRAGLETLALSRQLATIRVDLELPTDLASTTRQPPDTAKLRELYTRLEFRGLLRSLDGADPTAVAAPTAARGVESGDAALSSAPGDTAASIAPAPAHPPAPPREYEAIVTADALQHWMTLIDSAELTAFDTETTSLDYRLARIVGMSFCVEAGKAAYLPLAHRYAGAPDQLDLDKTLALLKPWLENPARAKLGHHLKYDAHVLRNHGINAGRHAARLDAGILSCSNSVATRHDMDSVAKHYLGIDTIKYEDVAGKGAKQIGFDQVPVENATQLCRRRRRRDAAACTRRCGRSSSPSRSCSRCTRTWSSHCRRCCWRWNSHGVLLDGALLRKQSGELGLRMLRSADAGACRGGRRVQPRFAEAAAADPVREAAAAGDPQDANRPAFHRRGCARGTGRQTTTCRG